MLACDVASWKYPYPKESFKADVNSIIGHPTFAKDMESFEQRCMRMLKEVAPASILLPFGKALSDAKPPPISFENFKKHIIYLAHVSDAAFLAKIITSAREKHPVIFFAGSTHTKFIQKVLGLSGCTILEESPATEPIKPAAIKLLLSALQPSMPASLSKMEMEMDPQESACTSATSRSRFSILRNLKFKFSKLHSKQKSRIHSDIKN